MTTLTNWPNPERPGVPMFPERDGWHILQPYSSPGLFYWDSENQYWFDRNRRYYQTVPEILVDAVETKYISACFTPAQIAEMLAGERERCAKVCDSIATSTSNEWMSTAYDPDNRAGDAAEETAEICAQQIRNLGAAP